MALDGMMHHSNDGSDAAAGPKQQTNKGKKRGGVCSRMRGDLSASRIPKVAVSTLGQIPQSFHISSHSTIERTLQF
jgi:hypothetical protein